MARPTTIKDETIIAAAREVFLEKGIQATTAEVAERAGVSEGTIFNRFKTKYELFQAAMEQLEEPVWVRTLTENIGKRDVRETLETAALQAIEFFRKIVPLMMMSWSNQKDGLPAPLTQPNPPPLRALRALTGYFEAEMRGGRLRRHDPEICARSFAGSVQSYVFFEILMTAHQVLPLPAETFVRGLVNLFWTGAEPVGKGA